MAMLLLTASTASSTPLSLQALSQRKEVTMGVSNGIVTAPINPQEVYNLLGVGKYNDFYDIGYLCSNNHGKINKWAKYKPVVWNALDNEVLPHAYPWHVGSNGLCGFSNLQILDITQIINAYNADGGKSKWAYVAPKGGAEPFRILDFTGYKHAALPFIYSSYRKGVNTSYSVSEGSVTVTFTLDTNNDSGSLSISDFAYGSYSTLKDAKFSIIALPGLNPSASNISGSKVFHGDKLSGNAHPSVSATFTRSDIGAWCILFCLSFETSTVGYIPIPSEDDNHYWMTNINIVDNPSLNVGFDISKIGYTGSVSIPLQDIDVFLDKTSQRQKTFKVDERGKFEMEVTLFVKSNTYTIYNKSQIVPFIRTNPDGNVDSFTIPDCVISKIDGAAYTSGNKVLSKGTHTLYISNGAGGLVVPTNFTSGYKYIGLLDNRYSLVTQTPLFYTNIYIERVY